MVYSISVIKKQQGAVLIIVLLFCSISIITMLFGLESALLQNKMASNYHFELVEYTKAQKSLDRCQQAFWHYPDIYPACAVQVDFLQWVPDPKPAEAPWGDSLTQLENPVQIYEQAYEHAYEQGYQTAHEIDGQTFYKIYSDPQLKVRLQSTIAIRRTKTGVIKEIKRKTWEEIRE